MRLRDTKPFTWHRLKHNPDMIVPKGPTAFKASWNITPWGIDIEIKEDDDPRYPCGQYMRITGPRRVKKYLDTEIVER